MENFEQEVTDIIKGYISSFLQVRSLCPGLSEADELGIRRQPIAKLEEQGHCHLPSYLYRVSRVHAAGVYSTPYILVSLIAAGSHLD